MNALYGEEIPQITSAHETIVRFHGTLKRESQIILRLLQRKYIQEESSFEAGIMSITFENLAVCPSAQKVYKSGVNKYSGKQYERNVLDDMRLSLELLVKQFLKNDKSLENQIFLIGSKMKDCGVSSELRNVITKIVDYMCDYQNSYVKHNDAVKQEEIEYVIEQTSAVINFIVKLM